MFNLVLGSGAIYWYNDGLNYITSFFIVIAVGLVSFHACSLRS